MDFFGFLERFTIALLILVVFATCVTGIILLAFWNLWAGLLGGLGFVAATIIAIINP